MQLNFTTNTVINMQIPVPPAFRYVGFRCLHMAEGGHPHSIDDPAVRPSANAPSIEFTKDMQLISWELMNTMNPIVTKDKWRVVYEWDTAFTNFNGFNEPGDQRADFVNNKDLDCPLPKLMKALICGGMFIRGNIEGNMLVCLPGVHAIDGNKPMPSIQTVLQNNWYFRAVTANMKAVSDFPQGFGGPIMIPYILVEAVSYPLAWFTKWDDTELPNPLKFYIT